MFKRFFPEKATRKIIQPLAKINLFISDIQWLQCYWLMRNDKISVSLYRNFNEAFYLSTILKLSVSSWIPAFAGMTDKYGTG